MYSVESWREPKSWKKKDPVNRWFKGEKKILKEETDDKRGWKVSKYFAMRQTFNIGTVEQTLWKGIGCGNRAQWFEEYIVPL